jgi:hypothetical protein
MCVCVFLLILIANAICSCAGQELLANSSLYRCILGLGKKVNIRVPLACVIDYRGFRLQAQAIVPINKVSKFVALACLYVCAHLSWGFVCAAFGFV